MKPCCSHSSKTKKCIRKDGKVFSLPRRFTRKRCLQGVKGFTMRSSCAPYNQCGGKSGIKKAVAVFDMNGIKGTVYFTQKNNDPVLVNYNLEGLKPGFHGFHVHEYGDLTDGCESACAHFNPTGKQHGGRTGTERHAGDFGNIITSRRGETEGSFSVKGVSLDYNSDKCIIGRSMIVHADRDDLGKGNNEESKKTGNAGKRLACAVIGLTR